MRCKLLLTTTCLAASLWASGCGQRHLCSSGPSRLSSDLCCSKTAKSTDNSSLRIAGAARKPECPEPKKSSATDPVLIVPPQSDAARAEAPKVLPLLENTPSARTSLTTKATPELLPPPPPSAEPRELPLPPAAFPTVSPASTTTATAPPTSYEEHMVLRDSASGGSPPAAPRKTSIVEFGATPERSTAVSNRSLTGEVQHFRRGWRLRYAAVDVADPHGGSVSLDGAGLDQLKEGARVRVTGMLIPAQDRLGSARFQVQSLEVLEY